MSNSYSHVYETEPLVSQALTFAAARGVLCPSAEVSTGPLLTPFGLALHPTPLPAGAYHVALAAVPTLNALLCRVAADRDYLRQHLAHHADTRPDFISRLLRIMNVAPPHPPLALLATRYDYLLDKREPATRPILVEMNIISSSYTHFGTVVSDMHRFLARQGAYDGRIDASRLVRPAIGDELPAAIALAHREFIRHYSLAHLQSVSVAITIDANSYVFCEISTLQAALLERHGIQSIVLTLKQANEYCSIRDSHLVVQHPTWGERTISIVYHRTGFADISYPTEKEWLAREKIERSTAVKCPTIASQLAATKRMQQVLSNSDELKRFIDCERDVETLQKTFFPQYSLCPDEGGERHVNMALKNPDKYVLKGQDDGNRSIYFGEKLAKLLTSTSAEERAGFTLMKKIHPVSFETATVKNGVLHREASFPEFSVWGIIVLGNGKQIRNVAPKGASVKIKPKCDLENIHVMPLTLGSAVLHD